jgi:phospholipase C
VPSESSSSPGSWSRRQFLGVGSAAAAAALLAACGSKSGSGSSSSSSVPGGTAGGGASAGGPGSLTDIDHVVILFQENRSYDQYFGTRKQGRGFGDPNVTKTTEGKPIWYQANAEDPDGYVLPYRIDTATTSWACAPDADHSWEGQHTAWNNGRNDRFGRVPKPVQLGYFARADLAYYYALADSFTVCDQYFCSVLGPTNPNRLYSMGATIDPAGTGGGPVIDNNVRPFTWTTYPERLQAAGISWRVYHEVDDYDDNVLKHFAKFQNLPESDPLFDNAMRNRDADAFVRDAASGNLPQVSWIVAPEAKSEHPSYPPAVGEDYVAKYIGAVIDNPDLFARTVFILSYDENGGFFDHVPPPTPEAGTAGEHVDGQPIGLGFRVPTVIISPWSNRGAVNSDVFDHTSTLLFLEKRFGVEVPNLTPWRRQTVGDLTTTLDFGSPNPTVAALPATAERAAAALTACKTHPPAVIPHPQVLPTTEA